MPSVADRLDGYQRRHRVLGFPLGVVYKFFDDQSNYLAAIITYYAFAAIFPLLLISSSILGFVLKGNPDLKHKLLDSALSQFPIVGTQLGAPEGLQGSSLTVVLGSLAALYGILGLGQASQNAVHVAWAIPRNSRPNPFLSRFNSALWLALAGAAVIGLATATSVLSNVDLLDGLVDRWITDLLSALFTTLVLAVLMQVATPHRESYRSLFPGAAVTAVLWQLLQRLGSAYVEHVVARASDLTATFAVPLGLLALLYVAANMAVIGLQVNVVLARRLWPRALLTPFTDAVDLTEADVRVYTAQAKAQRHKGFETVSVTFDKDGVAALRPDEPATAHQPPPPEDEVALRR